MPAISITGPQGLGGLICSGSKVSFTASPTNGGSLPSYQWQVNGVNTGTNSASYVSSSFANGDVVSCVLTSNAACLTRPTAVSNPVPVAVNPTLTPALSITAAATTVCSGALVSFTANPTNGGASPSYQWRVNGVNAGSNSLTYTNTNLANGNIIDCIMMGDAACAASPSATSNSIVEQVQAAVLSSVSIAAPETTLCSGTDVTFTARPANGGNLPAYQWQVNGSDVGASKGSFTSGSLADGDVVSCIMTGSLACSLPVASANKLVMTVNPTPTASLMPDTIIALGQSVVVHAGLTGPVTSYQWTPATGLDNPSAAAPVASPPITTTYQLVVTTDAKCTASGKVTIGVFRALKMPSAFSPNGDGKNDVFRIPPFMALKIKAFVVYNRWGARVFMTGNSSEGWDGTLGSQPQPAGTYVWEIEYEDLLTGKPALASGTVELVR